MKNPHHVELLRLIKEYAGEARIDPLLGHYIGNAHPVYAIRAPQLRTIARNWMAQHRDLTPKQLEALLSSLVKGRSATEKMLAGVLLDYARKEQRAINPRCFDEWLDHVEGWAEVDALCTNKYTVRQLPLDWSQWKKQLRQFARSKQIQKRRASLVLLCAPLRKIDDPQFLQTALENVQLLKHEKAVLITKAISWVLRSAVKFHKHAIVEFIRNNRTTLPAIAVRETTKVIETGRK